MKKIIKLIYRYDLIDEFLLKNKITKKQFCEICKLSLKTLYKFYHGKLVHTENLLKIVDILNVRVSQFLVGCERKKDC